MVGEVTQAQKDAVGRSEAIDLEAQLFPSDLCTAAQEGNTALIEEALQAGIAVDGADPDGKTALMTAGEAGQAASVRLLLRLGATADLVDVDGWSAAMFAAKENSADCIRLLAAAGANIELTDREFGVTAFLIACENGSVGAVSALAAAGADLSAVDSDGSNGSALAAAEQPPHTAVLDLLEAMACAVCEQPCGRASWQLPTGVVLCQNCLEAQQQGPEDDRAACAAAVRCTGGVPAGSAASEPTAADGDAVAAPPAKPADAAAAAEGPKHSDCVLAVRSHHGASHSPVPEEPPENEESLPAARPSSPTPDFLTLCQKSAREMPGLPVPIDGGRPKRPRSSFIYFSMCFMEQLNEGRVAAPKGKAAGWVAQLLSQRWKTLDPVRALFTLLRVDLCHILEPTIQRRFFRLIEWADCVAIVLLSVRRTRDRPSRTWLRRTEPDTTVRRRRGRPGFGSPRTSQCRC